MNDCINDLIILIIRSLSLQFLFMKYIIVALLFLPFSIKADIRNIPRFRIKDIKCFVEHLMYDHNFSYTIFGSKPMSLTDTCLKIPPHLSLYKHLKARFLFLKYKRELNTWYKYRNEFTFKDFIFLDKEEDLFDHLVLVLIHKKNLIAVLYDHEGIFKQELGEEFTPVSFVDKLEKREVSLAKAINNNSRLLGIMLGYGDSNALFHQERLKFLIEQANQKKEGLPEDEELNEKLQALEKRVGGFSDFEENALVPPLYFLADESHPETIALKERYTSDRKKIEELAKQPHFVDKALRRLIG